uniref:Very-long-chain (3R)-3-hydroxyacyl-CoA dehydratase n=1 Tax=Oryza punctata TaxID=4537 RepID=A0A0E0JE36_ORYPU
MARDASVVRRLYLSVYNWIVFIGWVQVSWSMILALLENGYEAVYAAVEQHLLFAQTAAIMEVTRYSFYGMKESFGFTPSWLLWLRYSTFIVCFPVGMVSEVGLVYIVLPFMKASEKYCLRMPNKWSFSFKYFYASVFFMALYAPVYPQLFRYLIAQWKKALAKAKTT